MLTISTDRIAFLLDKAMDVEIPEFVTVDGDEVTLDELSAELEQALSTDPAFLSLVEAIGALNPEEAYELLAVAQMGVEDDVPEWDDALALARSAAGDAPAAGLLNILLTTDAIENGLERLGVSFEEEGGEEEGGEEEGGEEDQDEEDEDDENDNVQE